MVHPAARLLPSPSGSTARKCSLFSSTASWKCSSVFSMIQRCISFALIILSLLTSTLEGRRKSGGVPLGPAVPRLPCIPEWRKRAGCGQGTLRVQVPQR